MGDANGKNKLTSELHQTCDFQLESGFSTKRSKQKEQTKSRLKAHPNFLMPFEWEK